MVTIRHETASDSEAIYHVERDAFGRDEEATLVDALRDGGNLLLSLVAEEDGVIVGHIAFSPMTIESDTDSHDAVCLGPVAVATTHQNQGIGGALIQAAIEELRRRGERAIFLLGHPTYYPRFGFRPAREFGVHYQDDRDAFMGLELQPGALASVSGVARFAPQFAPYE